MKIISFQILNWHSAGFLSFVLTCIDPHFKDDTGRRCEPGRVCHG